MPSNQALQPTANSAVKFWKALPSQCLVVIQGLVPRTVSGG